MSDLVVTKDMRNQLNWWNIKDVEMLIKNKKWKNVTYWSTRFNYDPHSQFHMCFIIRVEHPTKKNEKTGKPLKVRTSLRIIVEDLDELFIPKKYSILDEDGTVKTDKYDQVTLARIRTLRIVFEAIEHILSGICFTKDKLDPEKEITAEIRSPGIIFYHN